MNYSTKAAAEKAVVLLVLVAATIAITAAIGAIVSVRLCVEERSSRNGDDDSGDGKEAALTSTE